MLMKDVVAKLLYQLRAIDFAYSYNKSKSFVIMYHRVFRKDATNGFHVQPGMFVSDVTIDKHLQFFKKRFHVISLQELTKNIGLNSSLKNYCALTFDDGWQDNYANLFPLIKKYKLPITIFLSTDFIGTEKIFWPEEFSHFFHQISRKTVSSHNNKHLTKLMSELPERTNEAARLEHAITFLKQWSSRDRQELLDYLRIIFPRPSCKRLLLTWDEAHEMQESGLVTFGAHTAHHVLLDQVSLEEAEAEIARSKKAIVDNLGVTPKLFAYPNGNLNQEIKNLVKKHGFTAAVTTRKGWVKDGADLFELPRIGMHEDVSKTLPRLYSRVFFKFF